MRLARSFCEGLVPGVPRGLWLPEITPDMLQEESLWLVQDGPAHPSPSGSTQPLASASRRGSVTPPFSLMAAQ